LIITVNHSFALASHLIDLALIVWERRP
jgi:hypothetical protein